MRWIRAAHHIFFLSAPPAQAPPRSVARAAQVPGAVTQRVRSARWRAATTGGGDRALGRRALVVAQSRSRDGRVGLPGGGCGFFHAVALRIVCAERDTVRRELGPHGVAVTEPMIMEAAAGARSDEREATCVVCSRASTSCDSTRPWTSTQRRAFAELAGARESPPRGDDRLGCPSAWRGASRVRRRPQSDR